MKKNQAIIKQVVDEMGGTIKKIIPERNYFYINIGDEKIFINQKFVINDNLFSRKQPTNFKDLTYVLFRDNGIPTPKTVCFYRKKFDQKIIQKDLETLAYPIVIKDACGSNSKDVFTNIKTLKEAKKIILRELPHFACLIAQEMVFGKEYRVLVLGNRAIGVLEMIPPKIIGDGKSTVQELIEKKQRNKKKTSFDSSLNNILADQKVTLKTIPKKNQEIIIKGLSCLAEGGETKDATEIINKKIESLCVKVAKTVDKKLAGLDIICEDISKDPFKQKINIIEANRRPDIYIHYNPTYGKTQNVVKQIIEYMLKLKVIN
jgi:D-alanine-D-alanine ligase-like ATP-grasp enzyme